MTTSVALLATAPAGKASKRRVPHGFFGLVLDVVVANAPDDAQHANWSLFGRSGAESVRAVFFWARAQPAADSPPSFELRAPSWRWPSPP